MNLRRLLQDDLVEQFTSNSNQISDKISLAEKELKAAKKIGALNDAVTDDAGYKAAYNAMLQASTALMYRSGYRTKDRGRHHFATVEFIKSEYSGQIPQDAIVAFGAARSTRNTLQYDTAEIITNFDVISLTTRAEIFVNSAKTILGIT